MDKVTHNQTSIFLNSKNLLCTYQSGFQEKDAFGFSYLNKKISESFDQGMMTGMFPKGL